MLFKFCFPGRWGANRRPLTAPILRHSACSQFRRGRWGERSGKHSFPLRKNLEVCFCFCDETAIFAFMLERQKLTRGQITWAAGHAHRAGVSGSGRLRAACSSHRSGGVPAAPTPAAVPRGLRRPLPAFPEQCADSLGGSVAMLGGGFYVCRRRGREEG